MSESILTVLPLAVGSAIVPVHIVVAVLLVQGRGGRVAAAAWLAGQPTTRLVQGMVFGLILGSTVTSADLEPPSCCWSCWPRRSSFALVLAAFIWPARADAATARMLAGLTTYGRSIKIVLGVLFGGWFLVQALDGPGIV